MRGLWWILSQHKPRVSQVDRLVGKLGFAMSFNVCCRSVLTETFCVASLAPQEVCACSALASGVRRTYPSLVAYSLFTVQHIKTLVPPGRGSRCLARGTRESVECFSRTFSPGLEQTFGSPGGVHKYGPTLWRGNNGGRSLPVTSVSLASWFVCLDFCWETWGLQKHSV